MNRVAVRGNGRPAADRGRRRALVSQTRVPEIDRDSGSQQVDLYIRWLLEEGWSVSFLACSEAGDAHQAHRLRQLGVPTYVGMDAAEQVIDNGDFELAVAAFWEPASRLLPLIRRISPRTRVIIDSVDLHFLREARRLLGADLRLDDGVGARFAAELNTYSSAEGVLCVSDAETRLLAGFLGAERTHHLPVAKTPTRSEVAFAERSGMMFVGNFRHLPNDEAVEYLCREILPRLEPELLAEHPLSVIGSRLDDKVRDHARGLDGVRMVGWVPTLAPYLERSRVSVVPLLHGAGVKGKIIESLLAGTPVVTTAIGAEGLGLRDAEHALIADGPDELAERLARLLTEEREWTALADGGHELARSRHAPERVRERFLAIVEEVSRMPVRGQLVEGGAGRTRERELAYGESVRGVTETLASVTEADSELLVVSRGDDELLAVEGRGAGHFPQAPDGRWAGHHPRDSRAAIGELERLRERGARYLALPGSSFWWLNEYPELFSHLDNHHARIHSSEHALVFDLGDRPGPATGADGDGRPERVLVVGLHEAGEGAPEDLVAELDRGERVEVTQRWHRAAPGEAFAPVDAGDVDWVLYVREQAVLPSGFVDRFVAAASALGRQGVDRVQPAHNHGPDAGPPGCERLRGVLARELAGPTPLPVLAVRPGAELEGPTALVDATPIGLRGTLAGVGDPLDYSTARDVFTIGRARRSVFRSQWSPAPRISVVIATYDRADLLAECLEGFCEQTIPVSDFEIVVVDDGSPEPRTEAVLRELGSRLPLVWTAIEHAGRSAAKNLGVMLARGEVVLFFDDDDVAAPDLLAEHLAAHESSPEETTAILGHTEWGPGLTVSPLMHYLTDVDKLLFAYGHLEEGERLGWRCFWEGRVSSKRSLHLRHALHDQRLEYSIDVEMAWRLARAGLEVLYRSSARSYMIRPIDFDQFVRRCEGKGRAQAAIARLHDDPELHRYLGVEGAGERWEQAREGFGAIRERVAELEREVDAGPVAGDDDPRLAELHELYRSAFRAQIAKGFVEGPDDSEAGAGVAVMSGHRPPAAGESDGAGAEADPVEDGGEAPLLTVTMPVWSRTSELAEMAVRTIERVWEVARLPTEVVVVDNGSPLPHPGLRARVFRFEQNQGVASGWNRGIELARAPVICVLNSDCWVEPGWDEALHEAATSGRRIAFPYTDHGDGRGFRRPDQAGTAGWCFMLSREVIDEVGTFDARFNPAYVEDTDYWHRAWELGIELSPVPQARVTHARRTSADQRADWLLTGHRYLYGWKHGVEPMRAPPFYNREVADYEAQGSARSAATT